MLRKNPQGSRSSVKDIFDQHHSWARQGESRGKKLVLLALLILVTYWGFHSMKKVTEDSSLQPPHHSHENVFAMAKVKSGQLRGGDSTRQDKRLRTVVQQEAEQSTPSTLMKREQRMEPENKKRYNRRAHREQPFSHRGQAPWDEEAFAKEFLKGVKPEIKGERLEWAAKIGVGRKENLHQRF